jgi:hypothetical protein
MVRVVWLLLGCFLTTAEEKKPERLRYLKPSGGKWALESEVTHEETDGGSRYVSRTERGTESMTLTVTRDREYRPQTVELEHVKGKDRKTARIEWKDGKAALTRDGTTEVVKVPDRAVFTTAPDWSDILELVPRYDAEKGGKQEHAGFWFHPSQPHRNLAFTVEKTGTDKVRHKGSPLELGRFAVTIRSGTYKVWALPNNRVVKLLPPGDKAAPVVLEGYEETTRGLK